ncbi:MAG TPA: hypothetical protein VF765_21350 [Polyangiaceae bacterium]
MDVTRPQYELTLDELRSRVEEAEKLLRVARQLAADELRDPEHSTRAKDRIASLCKEVNSLFPAPPPDPELEAEAALDDVAGDPDTDVDEDDAAEDEDDDEEWEVDYAKLRSAIHNPVLMDHIPEAERAKFKEMAEQLLEAHERQELYARVTAGFEELERTTREGADEVGRHLAMALTFEELGKKYKA